MSKVYLNPFDPPPQQMNRLYYLRTKSSPASAWDYLQSYNPAAMNYTWGKKETAAKLTANEVPKAFQNSDFDLEACPEGEEPAGRRTATENRKTFNKPEIDANGGIDQEQRFIRRDGITTMPGTPITSREAVLREAIELICKEREEDYGSPDDSFATIAKLWSTYLEAKCKMKSAEGGHEGRILFYFLTPKDVAILNILQKVSRLVTSPDKRDGWIDIAGYAGLGGGMSGR